MGCRNEGSDLTEPKLWNSGHGCTVLQTLGPAIALSKTPWKDFIFRSLVPALLGSVLVVGIMPACKAARMLLGENRLASPTQVKTSPDAQLWASAVAELHDTPVPGKVGVRTLQTCTVLVDPVPPLHGLLFI